MTAELPKSMIWSRTLFPEGSIGQDVFPEILEGRERASAILTQPARLYIAGIKRWSALEQALVVTTGDLLTTTEETLIPWLKKPQSMYLEVTKKLLSDDLKALIFSPEDQLMQDIFGGAPGDFIIPPSLEPARRERILAKLGFLSEEENLVLRLRFGISTFIPKSLENIAKEQNMTSLHARRIKDNGLKKLRHPSISRELREFLPSE